MNVIYEHDDNETLLNADHYEVSIEQTGVVIGFNKANWLKSRKNGVDEKNMPKTLFVKPKVAIELPHGVALALAKTLVNALEPKENKEQPKQETPALPVEALVPLAQTFANAQQNDQK